MIKKAITIAVILLFTTITIYAQENKKPNANQNSRQAPRVEDTQISQNTDDAAENKYIQENFEGKTISHINITTKRLFPQIAKRNFPLKEGEIFTLKKYEIAKQSLHDMRIFKTIDFDIVKNADNTLTININAQDGYFVFPFIMATSGQSQGVSILLMENNLFRFGEFVMLGGAFSEKNYMFSNILSIKKNAFSVSLTNMDYTQSVYDNGAYSNSSFFSSSNKNEKLTLIDEQIVKEESWKIGWRRPLSEMFFFSVGYNYSDVRYPQNNGFHNTALFGLGLSKNMWGGAARMGSVGAIFGLGVSDLGDRFKRLPSPSFGYTASIDYENGNKLTGSEYDISKAYLKTALSLELPGRDIIGVYFSYADAFVSPDYDRVKTSDMFQRGSYSFEFRGRHIAAVGINFVTYVFKSKTGFLSLSPFIENAITTDENFYRQLTGVGLSAAYTFWKFPFPLGLRGTYISQTQTGDISFMFGASF
ncbi:MAG: hypothetical protein LBC07_00145 [Elusimicrobiota bacterium]|jgi:hypothetical protein|nr:hypothetical protein [Elusimicrobiota bacterium]